MFMEFSMYTGTIHQPFALFESAINNRRTHLVGTAHAPQPIWLRKRLLHDGFRGKFSVNFAIGEK